MNTTRKEFPSLGVDTQEKKDFLLQSGLLSAQSQQDRFTLIEAGEEKRVRQAEVGSYFTLSELTRSATAAARGIANVPSEEVVRNLRELVRNVLDPLRQRFGAPLLVTSGYRCAALNAAVGGARGSQHMRGEAADIKASTPDENKRLLNLLLRMRDEGFTFDQVIAEHCDRKGRPKWIHISYRPLSDSPRGEEETARRKNRRQILFR